MRYVLLLTCFLCFVPQLAEASTDRIYSRIQQRREERLAQLRLRSANQRVRWQPTYKSRRLERLRALQKRHLQQQNIIPRERTVPSVPQTRTSVPSRRTVREATRRTERLYQSHPHVSDEQYIFLLTNQERRKHGLPGFTQNRLLERAAQAHARDLYQHNYFSHTSRDGREPEQRIRATGYLVTDYATCNCRGWSYNVGENIARGDSSPLVIMQSWMHSAGHRENILSRDYEEIGIAKVGDIWVQNFGRMTRY